MTAPAFSPEVVARATAHRDFRKRHAVTWAKGTDAYFVRDRTKLGKDALVHFAPSHQECTDWIDCQAFAAGLQAVLKESIWADVEARRFIQRITSGSAQHDQG